MRVIQESIAIANYHSNPYTQRNKTQQERIL